MFSLSDPTQILTLVYSSHHVPVAAPNLHPYSAHQWGFHWLLRPLFLDDLHCQNVTWPCRMTWKVCSAIPWPLQLATMLHSHPKKHKKDSWHQIEKLLAELAHLTHKLISFEELLLLITFYLTEHDKQKQKRMSSRKETTHCRCELILWPAGKAGHNWTLCEWMGLIDNKRKYNYIRVCIYAYMYLLRPHNIGRHGSKSMLQWNLTWWNALALKATWPFAKSLHW